MSERKTIAARANQKKAVAAMKARRIIKHCEQCGVTMPLAPSVAATKRFCSWPCRRTVMVGSSAPNYGKGEKIRGPLNPNFRGWTPTTRTTGDVGRKFRRLVLERDGHRCIVCGATAPLNAHHIDDFASFPLLNGDPSNGLTLCVPCHKKAHSRGGGYGFITKEGKAVMRFGKRKTLPPSGAMRRTAIGTFLLGWE